MRERFLFAAELLKDTRFAKLSPLDVAAFDGEGERCEDADIGVDLPEAPLDRTAGGNIKPEPIGGGFLAGASELEDQFSPFRSSIAGLVRAVVGSSRSDGYRVNLGRRVRIYGMGSTYDP